MSVLLPFMSVVFCPLERSQEPLRDRVLFWPEVDCVFDRVWPGLLWPEPVLPDCAQTKGTAVAAKTIVRKVRFIYKETPDTVFFR